MRRLVFISICVFVAVENVTCYQYHNETLGDAVSQQLLDFRRRHPRPVGPVWTKTTGDPIDIRDTISLNTDIFNNKNHFRISSHVNRERIPERIVHAKGYSAFGYFEVTNDISKYTTADLFNGIGKRTPVVGRFSTAIQNQGGTELVRETKGLSMKLFTEQGNLDLLCLHLPIFLYRDPLDFLSFAHALKRNPRTDAIDNIVRWDFINLRPEFLHTILWLLSDFGLPDGYRKMHIFPIHTYEIYNKKGEQFFVKFNFRTEIGLFNLTNEQASAIAIDDPDYYIRDLYNAIAAGNYPAWKLELDILAKDELDKLDYDPFDVTRLWRRGTYRTVPVGRLVLNKLVDNNFKDNEQSTFSPETLVPGIMGPADVVFKARQVFYPDTQNYRVGVNHNNAGINAPLYNRNYDRDGRPPVADNMKDAPNYYPNSFNGPVPYVDENRPTDRLLILHRNAIDLQPLNEFYNEIVDTDAHRQRIVTNLASTLVAVPPDVEKKALRLLTLVDIDLGRNVRTALTAARAVVPEERLNQIEQCIANVNENNFVYKTKNRYTNN